MSYDDVIRVPVNRIHYRYCTYIVRLVDLSADDASCDVTSDHPASNTQNPEPRTPNTIMHVSSFNCFVGMIHTCSFVVGDWCLVTGDPLRMFYDVHIHTVQTTN